MVLHQQDTTSVCSACGTVWGLLSEATVPSCSAVAHAVVAVAATAVDGLERRRAPPPASVDPSELPPSEAFLSNGTNNKPGDST